MIRAVDNAEDGEYVVNIDVVEDVEIFDLKGVAPTLTFKRTSAGRMGIVS
jgi:hypothetical protein